MCLLRQLHSRDLRCRFCPEGHWVSNRFTMNSAYDKPSNMHFVQYTRRSRVNYRPFRGIPVISMDNLGKYDFLSKEFMNNVKIYFYG